MISYLKLLLGCLTLLLGLASAQSVTFINFADLHSAYNAMPHLLTEIETIVAEHPDSESYVLINGDLFEPGNVVAARSADEVTWAFLERLDKIAPVIVNLGNHEFDFLSPPEFLARADAAGLTVIGNLIDRGSGQLLAPAVTTLEIDDYLIDVVGMSTDALNTYAKAVRGSVLTPNPDYWSSYLPQLTVLADEVVLLSHAGVVADRAILPELPAKVAFVVGAHDHLVLSERVPRVTGQDVLYVHNGARGEQVRVVTLELASGEVTSELVSVSAPADPELAALVENVRAQYLTPEDTVIVGTVPEPMSLHEAANWAVETLKEATEADVAMLNHTSFGAGFAAGPLPKYAFDAFMRFDNDVMVAEMDGATLAQILELANQGPDTPLSERTGDFVYASTITPEPGQTYTLVTSSWVALPNNVMGYLGTDDLIFRKLEGVTTKGLLQEALSQ